VTDLQLLGVRVTAQTFEEAIGRIVAAAVDGQPFRAHFCTVHSLVEATSNRALAGAFETASMVCTDGMPLVWLARHRGFVPAERCAGPDVMLAVCDRGRALGLRHFLLGGAPGTAEAVATRLGKRLPGLHVSGMASPPFRPMTDAELDALADQVRASGADVLWIGLGAPKQDLFAADQGERFGPVVLLPVGAAFDFHAGRVRRAPASMRRLGLEWLFRLAIEPGRLWRRYLITNIRFVWLVLKEELDRRHGARQT
jgi:N-acetylglucosaminyldiphosphoundecaprenol N-acetyl-beta-D-mannosaminyltransferase